MTEPARFGKCGYVTMASPLGCNIDLILMGELQFSAFAMTDRVS